MAFTAGIYLQLFEWLLGVDIPALVSTGFDLRPRLESNGLRREAPPASLYARVGAQGGLKNPPCRRPGSRGIRFDSQSVVHSRPELLFASQVALGRLNRYVPQEKLDLVQFSGGEVPADVGCRFLWTTSGRRVIFLARKPLRRS